MVIALEMVVARGVDVHWPMAGRGQIPSLDGIRAVSVALVFGSHSDLSDLIPGGFGVTIFFFLSGYLITTLLCREHARTGTIAFTAFYLRRVIRLAPPMLITLVMAYVLLFSGLVPGQFSLEATLAQVFFVYNYYSLLPNADVTIGGLTILWSLAVEEHFYLVWPALFLLIARGRVGAWHIVGLLVAILLWRCYRYFVWGDDEWTIYISTDTRFDSLLYGCLLALLMARDKIPAWVLRGQVFYPVMVLALATLAVSFFWTDPAIRSTLRYTLQGLALMALFFYAVQKSDHLFFRPLNFGPVQRIGIYSYTIYLSHFVIIQAFDQMGFPLGDPLSMLGAAIVSVIWAAFVYRFFEQPLHGLRARLNAPQTVQP